MRNTQFLNRVSVAVALFFASLWAYPLARAISFFLWAQEYYNDTASINASNDLHYSRSLLTSYLGCLVSGFLFAGLVGRRPHPAFLFPGIILITPAIAVTVGKPEAPIVLFTILNPWHLMCICMGIFTAQNRANRRAQSALPIRLETGNLNTFAGGEFESMPSR